MAQGVKAQDGMRWDGARWDGVARGEVAQALCASFRSRYRTPGYGKYV